MLRDPNHNALSALDSFNVEKVEPDAFDGGTTNARGDIDGTNDPFTLYTVTGDVLLRIFGVCTSDLTGGTATLEVGTANNTAAFIAQTTATDIDDGEMWVDASPSAETDTLANVTGPHVIVDGADIVETPGTANVTGGNLYYICLWRPLSSNGSVVAAV